MSSLDFRRGLGAVLIAAVATFGLPDGAEAGAAEDPGGWSATIEQTPANPVPYDTPVTVTVTITAEDGTPVAGVPIDFTRYPNPGDYDDRSDMVRLETDGSGNANYVFQPTKNECQFIVSALVRDPDDDTILNQLHVHGWTPCYEPMPQFRLRGHSSHDGKRDILKVRGGTSRGPVAQASVDLYRLAGNEWMEVGGRDRVLDPEGKAVFRVRDGTRGSKTPYQAVIGPTATTAPGDTRVLRLR